MINNAKYLIEMLEFKYSKSEHSMCFTAIEVFVELILLYSEQHNR